MTYSRFLPESFDPTRPIAVIAGKEIYPKLTLESIRRHNLPVRLIAFAGETREDIIESFPKDESVVIKVGQMGRMLAAIRKFEAGYAMMVGQVTPRRLVKGLHPDAKAVLLLSRLKEKNAETIFGAVSNEIEKHGARMLDARSFLDHELAEVGVMTGGKPGVREQDIEHGIKIARGSAQLHVGQGVVVRKGTVIAVEAFEGTDAMLRRAGSFKTDQMIFVKASKVEQDFRFDVPVFGLRTLEVMREAGIGIACLEAEVTLILEKQKVIREARNWGLQLIGY